MSEQIFDFLESRGIQYSRYDHPAVFTCEEAARYVPRMDAVATKNLFLRDKKGLRHFLVCVAERKHVDLKRLGNILEAERISMASPERLRRYLGVERGAVTLLGLVNDVENKVEVVLDVEIWAAAAVQCHPLVNTSTLAVSQQGLREFFAQTRHQPRIIDVPQAAEATAQP